MTLDTNGNGNFASFVVPYLSCPFALKHFVFSQLPLFGLFVAIILWMFYQDKKKSENSQDQAQQLLTFNSVGDSGKAVSGHEEESEQRRKEYYSGQGDNEANINWLQELSCQAGGGGKVAGKKERDLCKVTELVLNDIWIKYVSGWRTRSASVQKKK